MRHVLSALKQFLCGPECCFLFLLVLCGIAAAGIAHAVIVGVKLRSDRLGKKIDDGNIDVALYLSSIYISWGICFAPFVGYWLLVPSAIAAGLMISVSISSSDAAERRNALARVAPKPAIVPERRISLPEPSAPACLHASDPVPS